MKTVSGSATWVETLAVSVTSCNIVCSEGTAAGVVSSMVWTWTGDDVRSGAEAIMVSELGCWEQAGVLYSVFGKYASAAITSGLKVCISETRHDV